jgi:16S rRNA (cytosine967-C5)-methyltransferase
VTREELKEKLENRNISVRICDTIDSACYINGYDSLASIPEFNQGLFYIQDYSSQLVPYRAGIKDTDKVIDVCAAPGGKALHAAQIASKGSVEARDLTEAKVSLINENIQRTGATNITAKQWDATEFDQAAENQYDVVIADLPCSGLGIIRKKPDIKYNQTEASLGELVQLQAEILENAARYVKAGGVLCYSTCTINKDENENQVANFLSSHSQFKMIESKQLLPDKNHDGFFVCVMKKN